MDFICDRCGQVVIVTDPAGVQCPGCSTQFDAHAVEHMLARQVTEVPGADMHRAMKMLGQSKAWINQRREARTLETVYGHGVEITFRLSDLHRVAEAEGLSVTPLAEGGALWIPKAQAQGV